MGHKIRVYEELKRLGVTYETVDHPAVYTIDELEELRELTHKDAIVKNLFLRDAGGKRHFLVVLNKDKKADLKQLRVLLGTSALSFASEDRLMTYLGLTKGAVTPLGIMNDETASVEVVLDQTLACMEQIGVHPNDNTSTVFLSFEDLMKVIESHGNPVRVIEL